MRSCGIRSWTKVTPHGFLEIYGSRAVKSWLTGFGMMLVGGNDRGNVLI